jgi:hypothetical protein
MNFNPKHVLVGHTESYAILEDARKSHPHHCWWVVPKNSKQGETVLLLIGKEFVGEAMIREDAQPSDVPGEYRSTLEAIKLWEPKIVVANIGNKLRDWKYLTYTRSYVTVPEEFQAPLRLAINEALEQGEMQQGDVAVINRNAKEQRATQEVISLPAGSSFDITEDTGVHACPEEYPWSSYQEAVYMTFRPTGGAMKRLYRVEWKGILPRLSADLELVPLQFRERVKTYIERREREWHFTGENFKFYVLSTSNNIELPHAPKIPRNIQGHCYFRLADLRSGQKIVQVASQSDGSATVESRVMPLKQAIAEVDAAQLVRDEEMANAVIDPASPFDTTIFDPQTLTEAREYQARQVVARRGQVRFRQMLLDVYGGQCAFTGYFGGEALEAAHIVPYCGSDSDHVANGLLLRADVHTLFDHGLIVVDTADPHNLKLVLAPSLLDSSYKILKDKMVRQPENPTLRPSLKALEWHRKQAGI